VRAAPGDVESLVRHTAELDGKQVAVRLEQEPGAAGKALVQRYIRDVLYGWDVVGVSSTGDKITRAKPASAQASAGNMSVLPGQWTNALFDELEAFPVGHDDQVDALSGAVDYFATPPEWGAF
jgi:predicted phage terminase large subunit-like protein